MCGIAGILAPDAREVDEAALGAAARAMHHRGPDGETTWRGAGVGLAHTRLAVIDIAGGAQPMFTEDERYVVVFNGEIYNHLELRRDLESHGARFRTHSDTEVLLHLYARYGPAMVERLRGMFAFAVLDRYERQGLLARDRFGKKPLCYAETDGALAFASTLDALRPLLPQTPEVDPAAIAEYLVLQYVPAPRSAYLGVTKLPPGHALVWSPGRAQQRPYWSPPARTGPASRASRLEEGERVRGLIHQAVTIRLESEVPLGVFLSGGLDSSVVVAELAAAGAPPATYSVGFKHRAFDETRHARQVAERFGTEHHELVADDDAARLFEQLTAAYDEPFADSSALATLAVAEAARDHVTVILTGDGGDELFGGYSRYGLYRRASHLRRRLGPLATPAALGARAAGRVLRSRRLAGGGGWVRRPWPGYRDALFHFHPAELGRILSPEVLAASDPWAPVRRLDGLWDSAPDDVRTLLWIDEQTYLPDDLLVKMDRATMAHSLEGRSPLLDHVLAEYASALPEDLLFDGAGVGKALIRDAYRDVLPPEILARGKMGFGVPLAEWLRRELRPAVEGLLLSEGGPLWTWLRPEGVRPLVQRFLGGNDGGKYRVWNLLALAGWADARAA